MKHFTIGVFAVGHRASVISFRIIQLGFSSHATLLLIIRPFCLNLRLITWETPRSHSISFFPSPGKNYSLKFYLSFPSKPLTPPITFYLMPVELYFDFEAIDFRPFVLHVTLGVRLNCVLEIVFFEFAIISLKGRHKGCWQVFSSCL